MKNTNKKGFTIVELVIVIAVIAILAAVLIPTFAGLVNKANLSADQQAVNQMNKVLAMVEAENGKPTNMSDVVKALSENNLVPDGYKALTKNHAFYWDSEKNTVLLWSMDDNKVVYPQKDYKDISTVAGTWRAFTSTSYTYVGNTLATGGVITITEDIAAKCENRIPAGMVFSGGEATTVDFSNKKYSYDVTYESGMNGAAISALYVCDNANITIKNADLASGGYGIYVTLGATLTIESGTFTSNDFSAVQVGNGTVYIKGGHFEAPGFEGKYLINCLDGNYEDGSANVVITGGTFVNFNPANNASEGAGTNFVAEGYKVVSEVHDKDTWYTVVPNTAE